MKRWLSWALPCACLGAALPALALLVTSMLLPPVDLERAKDRSTVVLDREGRLMRPFVTADGRWKLPVTSAEVDPRFLAMLIAYEDKRFHAHFGIDVLALMRSAGQMLANGHTVSGGSTLTMQVARLLEPREKRNLTAKLRQMARALQLERRLGKYEILDLYLMLAPYGGNIEGVRAASFAYFGKEPKRLSTGEAALLVALPQSPELRRPDRSMRAASTARERILIRAGKAGLATPGEMAVASGEPIPTSRLPFPAIAPHLAEQMTSEQPARRVHRLTIDAHAQKSLEQLARERSAALGPKLSIAIFAMDNATGEVRASVGGVDYFAAERAGSLDLTKALRSPGSALKPLIYALAFDNGIAHPETMLEDRPTRYGLYAPENFDLSFQGMVSARKALQMSLNVPTVALLSSLGPQRFLTRLKETGVVIALPKEGVPGLALGLGGLGITLQDLTRLYAGMARGGDMVPLKVRADEKTHVPVEAPQRFLSPAAAWYIADILLGAPPPANASPGRIAFKTGTSYGYRDAWAVGFDARHTIGVWVGRADNGAAPGLVGRAVAAPILFDAFARMGLDTRPFPPPADAIIASNQNLPPPLRHLRQDVAKTMGAISTASLRIAFPPDGARIELSADGVSAEAELSLKASGGTAPFTWLVNGAPVLNAQSRRNSAWTPNGLGFLRISVIDGQGASDSVAIRLQ